MKRIFLIIILLLNCFCLIAQKKDLKIDDLLDLKIKVYKEIDSKEKKVVPIEIIISNKTPNILHINNPIYYSICFPIILKGGLRISGPKIKADLSQLNEYITIKPWKYYCNYFTLNLNELFGSKSLEIGSYQMYFEYYGKIQNINYINILRSDTIRFTIK